MREGAEWLSAMEALLCETRFDLVIPCDERAMLPLQRHRTHLAPLARLAIPDDQKIAVLFDKYETRELARRVGVPVAAGRLLNPADTAEAVVAQFGTPVVVKPRHSYSLEMLASRGKVEVVSDLVRLQRVLMETDPGETVLEQFFAGQGVGVSLLASHGHLLQAFEHHRVREEAGASFYRVSAPLTPDLVQACESIVAATSYTGLAMFEFKRNRDDGWILLEVNARPWGSMPLPVALGVDFPYRWYRLLTAGEETPAVSYRTGVYGRNLVPDLRASVAEAEARRLNPAALAWFGMRRAAELLRPLAGKEVHDLLVRDDPRPGLSELTEIAGSALRRGIGLLPGEAARQRRHARNHLKQALRTGAGTLLVLFVCQGNICRSPFAAALLQALLGDSPIRIGSAGMIPQPGRPTPALGLQAAAALGIDLSSHRSTWLTREAAEAATLLFVFDDTTRAVLLDRYPHLKAPVIGLGDVAGVGSIADPIDGDLGEFRRIYEQIAASITELASLVRGSPA